MLLTYFFKPFLFSLLHGWKKCFSSIKLRGFVALIGGGRRKAAWNGQMDDDGLVHSEGGGRERKNRLMTICHEIYPATFVNEDVLLATKNPEKMLIEMSSYQGKSRVENNEKNIGRFLFFSAKSDSVEK